MKAISARVLTLAAVLSLTACASAALGVEDPFRGEAALRPATIEILNNNFNDATVWAVFRAQRVRLGTVTGKTTSTFRLPARHTYEPVSMEIDLVGGDRCVTETLIVDEGDVLYLEIAIDLAMMRECR